MTTPAPSAYERYLPWKRTVEIGYWLGLTLVNTVANSVTVLMDVRRVELTFADWEPVAWETSSGLMLLLLVPPLVWFTRRFPLHWDNLHQQLPRHLLGSVAFSVAHVAGMVGLRKVAYASQGLDYDFGSLPVELTYEYLKDIRTYVGMVATIEIYRLVLRRMQGEATLLAEPDEGEAVEPTDRPERFLVRKLGREFLVAAGDIEWLQAAGNYVNLRVRGHDYPLRSTISGIEAKLDPARFVRIHRSYMVNLDLVTSIQPLESGEAKVQLKDGTELPCSRRYRDALRGPAIAA